MRPKDQPSLRRWGPLREDRAVVIILVAAGVAILLVLVEVPFTYNYTATLKGDEAPLNVPAHSRVTVEWRSNGPFCGLQDCGWVSVAVLPNSSEIQADSLNSLNPTPADIFSFTAESSSYYIWLVMDIQTRSGITYTVSYTAPLL